MKNWSKIVLLLFVRKTNLFNDADSKAKTIAEMPHQCGQEKE